MTFLFPSYRDVLLQADFTTVAIILIKFSLNCSETLIYNVGLHRVRNVDSGGLLGLGFIFVMGAIIVARKLCGCGSHLVVQVGWKDMNGEGKRE
jgi:hypothetical protein